MNIGEKIRKLRERIGISPEKLGDRSDVSGAYIRQIENGQRKTITLETARKLACGLGVKISDLVDMEDLPAEYNRPIPAILQELTQRFENMEQELEQLLNQK